MMKSLYIYPVEGLYNELFNPNPKTLIKEICIKNNVLDVNGYFWAELFDKKNVLQLIEKLKLYSISTVEVPPQFTAILSNIENFLSCINEAQIYICDQGNTEKDFFKYIETINILIELYNKFGEYPNIRLSIQDGYIFDDYSYKNINEKCLLDNKNPYLNIIIKKIIPVIEDYNPDIIFIVGKPSYFNVAITKIIKSKNKNIKFCITRHSSEYYSLNKIIPYLQKNEMIFSDFDYIILECFEAIEYLLMASLDTKGKLLEIPNIMFKNQFNEIITTSQKFISNKTPYNLYKRTYINEKFKISPQEVADVHIAPYSKCYWNKCSFCGINKKYSHDYKLCQYDEFFNNVYSMIETLGNIKYLWFIDEALNVEQLSIIADCFLENHIDILWQARTRIEKELLSIDLAEKLYKSGLRELRLGLESACMKTLKNMNKFDDDFSLGLVNDIIKLYTSNNISIHFPIIIGFPQESNYDRNITYEYLKNIIEDNKLITFNINILNLDVSSVLFKNWFNYGISSPILPCLPEHFIGNIANWEGEKIDYKDLEYERNSFMRETLYPWYPKNAITTPIVYYRLIESIRNTLIIKSKRNYCKKTICDPTCILVLSNKIIISHISNDRFLVYDWNTHHYFKCNKNIIKIILEWNKPMTIKQYKECVLSKYKNILTEDDLDILISKFIIEYHFVDIK